MMMIEKVMGIDFIKDKEITDLKPQFPAALVITMDVPSTSAAPHSRCSGTVAPPPATSSSSSGGILRRSRPYSLGAVTPASARM
jgi:hypothetical protein